MSELLSNNKLKKLFNNFLRYVPNPLCVKGQTQSPSITIKKSKEHEIKYPLTKEEIKVLHSLGSPSPYGKGTKTEWDDKIRKGVELDSDKFEITFEGNAVGCITDTSVMNSQNIKCLEQIRRVLAPHVPYIECKAYKLLLYETGGHFAQHIDTMRETGHFATLVLALPCDDNCKHRGGNLVLEFENQQMTWNPYATDDKPESKDNININSDKISTMHESKSDDSNCTSIDFIAFYCDISHQILKVTQGTRVTVTLNLIIPKRLLLAHLSQQIKKNRKELKMIVNARKHINYNKREFKKRVNEIKEQFDKIEAMFPKSLQFDGDTNSDDNDRDVSGQEPYDNISNTSNISIYQKQIFNSLTKCKLVENLNIPHVLLYLILSYYGEHGIIRALLDRLKYNELDPTRAKPITNSSSTKLI